jgi:hypothetical protein
VRWEEKGGGVGGRRADEDRGGEVGGRRPSTRGALGEKDTRQVTRGQCSAAVNWEQSIGQAVAAIQWGGGTTEPDNLSETAVARGLITCDVPVTVRTRMRWNSYF